MAVVEMKRVNLLAMQSDRQPILRLLQRLSCCDIQTLTPEESGVRAREETARDPEETEKKLAGVEWAIRALGKYAPQVKKGFLASFSKEKPFISSDQCGRVRDREAELLEAVTAAESCEKRAGELNAHAIRTQAAIDQFRPWEALDIPLQQIGARRTYSVLMGQMPTGSLQAIREEISAQGLPAEIIEIGVQRTLSNVVLFTYAKTMDALNDLLMQRNYVPVHFPGVHGTMRENIQAQEAQIKRLDAERVEIEAQWRQLATYLPDLKVLHDLYQAERLRTQAAGRFIETDQTFYMRGWVPASVADALAEKLREIAPVSAVEIADPLPDEKPPTMLKNHWFPSQFEGIVAGFSMPDPRGVDPSFMMAPFFACFFGMMLSDAGYGIVLALLIPLIIHIAKPKGNGKKLLWVLGLGGISTIIWGALFNTWFGAGIRPILLDPMQQPLEMVALCLVMGLIHLFAAMGVGAYQNIKNGDPWAAVFDQFSWIAMITGVILLFLPGVLGISEIWSTIGKVFALGGLGLVLLFAGRDKKNIFKRITGGLGALYGITGWLGDILSYTRLFGMGLATGVVGMVINMLAGMVWRKGVIGIVLGVIVLVGGHAFNMALNALGAYVHSCRLQYIEFFGKFYQDGGVPFKPLRGDTKYVDLSGAD